MNDQPTPQPRLQLFDWLRDPSLDVDLARPITYVAKIGPDGQPQYLFAQEVPYPSGDAMFVLGQQLRGHLERVPTTVAIAFGLSAKAVLVDSSGMVGVLPHDRRGLRYHRAADGLPHLCASLVQLTRGTVGYERVVVPGGVRGGAPGFWADAGRALSMDYLASTCERRGQQLHFANTDLHRKYLNAMHKAVDVEVLEATGLLLELLRRGAWGG